MQETETDNGQDNFDNRKTTLFNSIKNFKPAEDFPRKKENSSLFSSFTLPKNCKTGFLNSRISGSDTLRTKKNLNRRTIIGGLSCFSGYNEKYGIEDTMLKRQNFIRSNFLEENKQNVFKKTPKANRYGIEKVNSELLDGGISYNEFYDLTKKELLDMRFQTARDLKVNDMTDLDQIADQVVLGNRLKTEMLVNPLHAGIIWRKNIQKLHNMGDSDTDVKRIKEFLAQNKDHFFSLHE